MIGIQRFLHPASLVALSMLFSDPRLLHVFRGRRRCALRSRPVSAFSQSRRKFLTQGHRWQIFGALILIFMVDVIVSVVARMLASRVGADAGLIGADTDRLIASFIVQAVFLAFIAVVAAVFHRQARVAKDGADIASAFDRTGRPTKPRAARPPQLRGWIPAVNSYNLPIAGWLGWCGLGSSPTSPHQDWTGAASPPQRSPGRVMSRRRSFPRVRRTLDRLESIPRIKFTSGQLLRRKGMSSGLAVNQAARNVKGPRVGGAFF